MKTRILISIFILATSSLFAKTNHWTLVFAHRDTISNVSLQQLKNDSLTISGEGFTKCVPINSIMELLKPRKPNFWKGAGIGLLTGTVAGGLLGWATYSDSK
jgi:hypothetical protein